MDALSYTGSWIDRVSDLRADPSRIHELREAPDARVIPLWRDQCLVSGDRQAPVTLTTGQVPETVFLGVDAGGNGVFAADLSDLDEGEALAVAGADEVMDVRSMVTGLSHGEATTIAYARGLLYWNRNQRYCGACGAATVPALAGHQRVCRNQDCGRLHFPKIEPAVIMTVQTAAEPERILLGHHRGSAAGRYSALAGFVEIGESLEDAVRREVREETGVQVSTVTYVASQAWPFPSGIMIGFRATAVTEQITADGEEVLEARWFTRAELAQYAADYPLGRPDSIDCHLLRTWLAAS